MYEPSLGYETGINWEVLSTPEGILGVIFSPIGIVIIVIIPFLWKSYKKNSRINALISLETKGHKVTKKAWEDVLGYKIDGEVEKD